MSVLNSSRLWFATDRRGQQSLPMGLPVDVAIVKQVWVVVTVSADNAAQCSLLPSTPKTATKERRYSPSGRVACLDLMGRDVELVMGTPAMGEVEVLDVVVDRKKRGHWLPGVLRYWRKEMVLEPRGEPRC
jgi:hypothetical protein